MLAIIFLLLVNFLISWGNAKSVGRYWSESKELGGFFWLYVWIGYIMSIAGFTMVYGYILLMALPYILPLVRDTSPETIMAIQQLASDALYVLVGMAVIPTGFLIWFQSVANFWERKTVPNAIVAGWNTYVQFKNTVTAAREMPSAIGRLASALFGGKGKKKADTYVILVAIFVVIVAALSGYLTASAILKKADREYNAFEYAEKPQLGN